MGIFHELIQFIVFICLHKTDHPLAKQLCLLAQASLDPRLYLYAGKRYHEVREKYCGKVLTVPAEHHSWFYMLRFASIAFQLH